MSAHDQVFAGSVPRIYETFLKAGSRRMSSASSAEARSTMTHPIAWFRVPLRDILATTFCVGAPVVAAI